jgi:hypothetical protein
MKAGLGVGWTSDVLIARSGTEGVLEKRVPKHVPDSAVLTYRNLN